MNTVVNIQLSLESARDLAFKVFRANGCSERVSIILADVITVCERDGPASHGFFSIHNYMFGLRGGHVNGNATPLVNRASAGVIQVDGDNGYSQIAIRQYQDELIDAARCSGIAILAIRNAHNIGPLRQDIEPLATQGLMAFTCVVSRPHMAPHGGNRKFFGTNPIAFACPRTDAEPLVWDMSTSAVSLMEIQMASKTGAPIPKNSAIDKNGQPTTNSKIAADEGTLLPFSGHKGSALALMVELMGAGITGGRFAFEDSDPDADEYAFANRGQSIIAIEPKLLYGCGFEPRVSELLEAYQENTTERIPGDGRLVRRQKAETDGILIDSRLLEEIRSYL